MKPLTARFIETHWPLSAVSLGKQLHNFETRQVSGISANEGQFIIKVSDQWHSIETATRHTFIFDYLQEKRFGQAPAILKTRSGQNFQPINEHFAIILSYIAGKPPAHSKETYWQLGETLAALHGLPDYPYPYLFTVDDVLPEFFEWATSLPFGKEYLQLVGVLPDFKTFPPALIHGEMIGNSLQTPDGAIVILDWDEAGVGTRILDLGHPLIQIFLTEDLIFDQAGAQAFYQGYQSKGSLTEREKDHIFDAALFYALRYVIYGDTTKRWQRILYAVNHRAMLSAVIREVI